MNRFGHAIPSPAVCVVAYLALTIALTWPTVIHPIAAVPGAARTDLWDSLWTFWFIRERCMALFHDGATFDGLTSADGWLNYPIGGVFWPSDLINAVVVLPLSVAAEAAGRSSSDALAFAWSMVVLGHGLFAGLAGHLLGRRVASGRESAGWIVGVSAVTSPFFAAQIHNGASEAVGVGWVALAMWALWGVRDAPGWRRMIGAGLVLGVSAVAHWYGGAQGFLFVGALVIEAVLRRRPLRYLVGSSAIGVCIAAPFAFAARAASTAPNNLVGIKSANELATLRRTIGAADPRGFFMPGNFRSPDFGEISRYSEQYVHCTYLGWVLLLAAGVGLWRRRRGSPNGTTDGTWVFIGIGLLAAILALGPVLTSGGAPVILPGRLGVPLPYLALERIPGFDSLSLIYRLSFLSVLSLAVLASTAFRANPAAALVAAIVLEARFVSPAATLPGHTDASVASALSALRDEPGGAVMNYPVAGGRPYLFEQTLHRHPVTGTLNFPNNAAAKRIWETALNHLGDTDEAFRAAVGARAKATGVRWLVWHDDPVAESDPYDAAMTRMSTFPHLADSPGVVVVVLY